MSDGYTSSAREGLFLLTLLVASFAASVAVMYYSGVEFVLHTSASTSLTTLGSRAWWASALIFALFLSALVVTFTGLVLNVWRDHLRELELRKERREV